jgi:hypothetical protein
MADATSSERPEVIRVLNEDDVLLGRGIGPSTYIGNVKMRDLAETCKDDYVSIISYKAKSKIAKRIYFTILSRGGRFLELVNTGNKPARNVVKEGNWMVATEKKALEKVKQTLRENRENSEDDKGTKKRKSKKSNDPAPTESSLPLIQDSLPSMSTHPLLKMNLPLPNNSISPAYSAFDSRLLLFQQTPNLIPENHTVEREKQPTEKSDTIECGARLLSSLRQTECDSMAPITMDADTEDVALMLSSLAVADRPRFTEEEEAIERASLTDKEKAAALRDLYGNYAADVAHEQKRTKRQPDRRSVDFLIQYMRAEIELYPVNKKQALIEAQEKCRVEEFGDARLEVFLRCEGMNAKLAAERFVNYWESRRHVFGEDFTLPMTLTGALRHDLAALQVGFYRLLPTDSHGRQVLFIEPHLITKADCSLESLLRAIWYVVEVAAQESTRIEKGCAGIGWDKESTIMDFDATLFSRLAHFEKCCWPIKIAARHVCCTSSVLLLVMHAILLALMDRESRSRIVVHNVPETEIIQSLSRFGLRKDSLPKKMGGDMQLDQSEWIASRRVIEMEEIS